MPVDGLFQQVPSIADGEEIRRRGIELMVTQEHFVDRVYLKRLGGLRGVHAAQRGATTRTAPN